LIDFLPHDFYFFHYSIQGFSSYFVESGILIYVASLFKGFQHIMQSVSRSYRYVVMVEMCASEVQGTNLMCSVSPVGSWFTHARNVRNIWSL